MDANGIQYHHVSIPGFTRRALVAPDSELMPQVVVEVVEFFAELAE
jgi:hypothetical protein